MLGAFLGRGCWEVPTADSAGAGQNICEMNKENRKISGMFERATPASLLEILFSVNEHLCSAAARTKPGHFPTAPHKKRGIAQCDTSFITSCCYLLFFFPDPLRDFIFMLSSYSRSSRFCCALARPIVHTRKTSAAPTKMNIARGVLSKNPNTFPNTATPSMNAQNIMNLPMTPSIIILPSFQRICYLSFAISSPALTCWPSLI